MLTANRKTEDCAFLALLIGVTALFLWMMLPFFDVIFWAATIGILFHPVYRTIAEMENGTYLIGIHNHPALPRPDHHTPLVHPL